MWLRSAAVGWQSHVILACLCSGLARHLRTPATGVMMAMVQAAAKGDWEEHVAPWSWRTTLLGMLFYMSPFGCVICCWEFLKYLCRRASLHVGLGPVQPTMKTKGTMTDVVQPAAVPVRAAAAPVASVAPARATHGTIMITTSGGKYHTRVNCGHIIGRNFTTFSKCLDCTRLDD